MKRVDIHRVGSIVPEDYSLVLSYNLATTEDGRPIPSFRVNCELDRRVIGPKGEHIRNGEHDADGMCCIIGMRTIAKVRFAAHGDTGACTICGAHFRTGDVWRHKDGEYIHVGHTCADKYEMLAERGDFDAAYESHKARCAAIRVAEEHRANRAAFFADHPGLEDAFKVNHPIIKEIEAKLGRYRSISEGQIALVKKLADEATTPPPAEVNVPAPEGRVMVRGKVVSTKSEESQYGLEYRMTVKVTTPDGVWLAWGTVPRSLLDDLDKIVLNDKGLMHHLRGCEVEFTATLTRGRDTHFAIAKRPTKARIVSVPATTARKELSEAAQ